jgi:predicted small lipoprotein YifL
MKKSYFLLVAMLLALLSACGMQGDLYLPDEKNKAEAQGTINSAHQPILDVVYKNRVYKV